MKRFPFRKSIPLVAIIPVVIVALVIATSQFVRCHTESVVVNVKDGDSIVLSDGREIRYIGIDCPEFGEPFFAEAKKFNQDIVLNKKVRIEIDIQEFDNYGRTLAYVFVGDTFVNNEIVKNGLANVYSIKPNVKYNEILLSSQQQALENKYGLWGNITQDEKYYVSTRNGERFHRMSCKYVEHKKELVKFDTKEEALKKGKSPCRECKP